MTLKTLQKIVSLCKRRGFIFQGSEIYGGLRGTYDYGPLGIELKKHIKDAWWNALVYERNDVEGIDTSILSHMQTFNYSGHAHGFSDLMVDCKDCKMRWRVDDISNNRCNNCGSNNLTSARPFNLMFSTHVGPIKNEDSTAFLRPETAQGIFINFKNVLDSTSRKIPFGIAQIGKAFRNEITPKNFIFRMREFEQMELEYFVWPGTDEQWHETWIEARLNWWQQQGISSNHLTLFEQPSQELAHYSKRTVDIFYHFPDGPQEIEGIANRTDFDLGSHTRDQNNFKISSKVLPNSHSSQRLCVYDDNSRQSIIPYVIEASSGIDRGMLALLCEAYTEETLDNGEPRTLLKLKPHLAPVKVAVIPLAKNNLEIMNKAKSISQDLRSFKLGKVHMEDSGNIGKCYRKNDEIGTPFCITIDYETIGCGDSSLKNTVTIRERDSMQQHRINCENLKEFIHHHFKN